MWFTPSLIITLRSGRARGFIFNISTATRPSQVIFGENMSSSLGGKSVINHDR
jgi:hypothetical protein